MIATLVLRTTELRKTYFNRFSSAFMMFREKEKLSGTKK